MTEEAKRDLAEFLPHLKLAIEMARIEAGPGGKVELGILGVHPDGTGQIVARFEPSFVDDLEKIVGEAPDLCPACSGTGDTIQCELPYGHKGDHKANCGIYCWPNEEPPHESA